MSKLKLSEMYSQFFKIRTKNAWHLKLWFTVYYRKSISKMMPSGPFLSGVITLRKWPMKSRHSWIKSKIEWCDWTLAQSYDAWWKGHLGIIFDILRFRLFQIVAICWLRKIHILQNVFLKLFCKLHFILNFLYVNSQRMLISNLLFNVFWLKLKEMF